MLRAVYVCIVRAHPPAFRRRFADEMLSIFDQETGRLSAMKLVDDGTLSLLRQWTIRRQHWHEPQSAAVAAAGLLSFPSPGKSRPASRTLFNGIMVSLGVFCMFWLAIIHGQNQIPERHGDMLIQKFGLAVLSGGFRAAVDASTNQNCQSLACLQAESTSASQARRIPAPQWQINAGGKMAFDIASVKVNKSGSPVTSMNILLTPGDALRPTGGRFRVTNSPLQTLLAFAYKLPSSPYLMSGLPNWANAERFDIEASADAKTGKDQFRLMVQSLLADR